jgi:hypothetical protein
MTPDNFSSTDWASHEKWKLREIAILSLIFIGLMILTVGLGQNDSKWIRAFFDKRATR